MPRMPEGDKDAFRRNPLRASENYSECGYPE
jgi:hypothetical protein